MLGGQERNSAACRRSSACRGLRGEVTRRSGFCLVGPHQGSGAQTIESDSVGLSLKRSLPGSY